MMNSASPSASPLLGCIADDFTGATDLANMLVRNGMRTIQTIGVPTPNVRLDADALIVALKSRTLPAAEAVEQSIAALAWLRTQGCQQFFFKYCSTFDSTDAGNIGPVTEALAEMLGASTTLTIACPAFPENGRTLFRGHLFVNDALLNESGMEKHPLTPMTDANLVRVLQRQTKRPVGLVRYDTIACGVAAVRTAFERLRADGVRLAITDALSDADLHTIGTACADHVLITGGSGIALGLPNNFRRAGCLPERHNAASLTVISGYATVLAGSASRATNEQVATWKKNRPAFRVDPLRIAHGEPQVDAALAFARKHFPEPVLIYATAPSDEVKLVQQQLGVARAGNMVENTLADIARGLFTLGVRKFVVAGGETSGAIVQALGVSALKIGVQIDPGVPVTATLDGMIGLALKSGNFGAADFFTKALQHLETPT